MADDGIQKSAYMINDQHTSQKSNPHWMPTTLAIVYWFIQRFTQSACMRVYFGSIRIYQLIIKAPMPVSQENKTLTQEALGPTLLAQKRKAISKKGQMNYLPLQRGNGCISNCGHRARIAVLDGLGPGPIVAHSADRQHKTGVCLFICNARRRH
jgi:hypothetical protein